MFEVLESDLAARIGRLETPHGIVETPTFVPVVHPVRQTVNTQYLKKISKAIYPSPLIGPQAMVLIMKRQNTMLQLR